MTLRRHKRAVICGVAIAVLCLVCVLSGVLVSALGTGRSYYGVPLPFRCDVIVLDADTDEPIAGALIKASQSAYGISAESLTDAKGVVSFDLECPWGGTESILRRTKRLGYPSIKVDVELQSYVKKWDVIVIPVTWATPDQHSVVATPVKVYLVREGRAEDHPEKRGG